MAIAESLSLIQCVTNTDMNIVHATGGMAELVHIAADRLCGTNVLALTHAADQPLNRSKLDHLKNADQPFAITKRYMRPDQSVVWVRNHVSRGPTDGGKPTLVATIDVLPDPDARLGGRDLAAAEWLLKVRKVRSSQFSDCFAHEPALDMMLLLFVRQERGLKSTVKTMCGAGDAPYSTAHRRFGELIDSGMATTAFDPADKRFVIACLTPAGRTRVLAFLQSVQDLG